MVTLMFDSDRIQMKVTRENLALLTLIHYAEYASF